MLKGAGITYMFASLKYRNFRLYFEGQCISVIGTWMQQIAMGWLAYRLTGSVMILATVTFMEQIPMLVTTPFMSVFTDRFNRHTLLVITQVCSMLQALTMAILVLTDTVAVWNILILSLFIGLINALDMPTRQAFYTSLVPKENLSNAVALNSSVINGCRLIGPAVGGVLIHQVGEGLCFLINGLSYIAVIIALLCMKTDHHNPSKTPERDMLKDIRDGFEYIRGDIPVRTLILMMAADSFFGVPFNSFLPAFVEEQLHGDSEMLGSLLSCVGVGAFTASVYLVTRKRVLGLEKLVMGAAGCFGLALLSISFISSGLLASVCCIPIGLSTILSVASNNTLLQMLTPEYVRGRVMGYLVMAFAGMPPLGSLFFGYLEKWIGLNCMMMCMGVCCLSASVAFALYLPTFYKSYPLLYARRSK